MAPTLGQAWRRAAASMRNAGIETPERDAQLLSLHALHWSEMDLLTREHQPLSDAELNKINSLIERRLLREPVARILGEQEFYGLQFVLNDDTLIPRPETEMLVDLGLQVIAGLPGARILDLGAGSGAIVISLLANAAHAQGVAVDLSSGALEAVKANADRHGVTDRLLLNQGSWFSPLSADQSFDLIVSNPPYIRPDIIAGLEPDVRDFDPDLALNGGTDGLAAYRDILNGIGAHLAPGGTVLFEIGYDQGPEVCALCEAVGLVEIGLLQDLAGQNRVVRAKST